MMPWSVPSVPSNGAISPYPCWLVPAVQSVLLDGGKMDNYVFILFVPFFFFFFCARKEGTENQSRTNVISLLFKPRIVHMFSIIIVPRRSCSSLCLPRALSVRGSLRLTRDLLCSFVIFFLAPRRPGRKGAGSAIRRVQAFLAV
jgi:hypothetical protein